MVGKTYAALTGLTRETTYRYHLTMNTADIVLYHLPMSATEHALPFFASPHDAWRSYHFNSRHFATLEQALDYVHCVGRNDWVITARSGAIVALPEYSS